MKNKLEFLVGLFFLFSFFCFFVLIFKITDISKFFDLKNYYNIKVIFRNIGSLKINAKVTIYGVKVGFVDKILLLKNEQNDYYVEVSVLINNKFDNLPIDSSASIFMTNLLGENYIQIELGNENVFLKNGDVILLTNQALILEELLTKFVFDK